MTDVIERLRAAEDRTQPPGPFDLAAATRAGQARRRRRRGTWVAGIAGIAAAVVVGSVFTWAGSGTPAEVADTPAHPLQDVDALLGEWSVHGLEPSDSLEEVRLSVTEDLAVVSTSCLSGYLWAAHPDGLMLMDPTLPLVLMDQIEENGGCERGFGGALAIRGRGLSCAIRRADRPREQARGRSRGAYQNSAGSPANTPRTDSRTVARGSRARDGGASGGAVVRGWRRRERPLAGVDRPGDVSPGGSRRQWSEGCNIGFHNCGSPTGGMLVSPVVITTGAGSAAGKPDPGPTWPPARCCERAGFDGDALVLFDAAGEELAVLTRDGSAAERTITAAPAKRVEEEQDDPPHDPMALRGKWMLTLEAEAPVQVSFGVPTGHRQHDASHERDASSLLLGPLIGKGSWR